MRGEQTRADLPIRESALGLWNLVAGEAGYAELEDHLLYTPFPATRQTGGAWLWTIVAVLERVVAAVLLLFVSPVVLVAAVFVILLSRRSPFIAHRRVGERGRELWVLKLRTMWPQEPTGWKLHPFAERIEDEPVSTSKLSRDMRVTSRVASLCRRFSIDELPQLLQVVGGDLALVGPRPLTKGELSTYYGDSALALFEKKPGLTGLWQVKGRSRLSYRQRRRLDLFLVQHWSFRLYVYILAVTIPRVVCGNNAW